MVAGKEILMENPLLIKPKNLCQTLNESFQTLEELMPKGASKQQ